MPMRRSAACSMRSPASSSARCWPRWPGSSSSTRRKWLARTRRRSSCSCRSRRFGTASMRSCGLRSSCRRSSRCATGRACLEMSALAIGGLGIVALFALILAQVPIGFAMIAVGVAGLALQSSWGPALTVLATEPASVLSNVDLATVPLFLLMGTFATTAGFSADIYNAVAALLGHRRGGLAYATIGGCAAFGVVCGSSTATAATFARVALPEMLNRGYSPAFSTGTIAAGGTLKSLIPPSIVMVLYCIATQTFIFDLFTAAVLPALIAIALNLTAIAVVVRFTPEAAPVSPRVGWGLRALALKKAAPALFLIVGVFGGLYSGVFTVTEAASVAAVLAFLFALVRRRMSWADF